MTASHTITEFLLSDAERELQREIGSCLGKVVSDDAFAGWLLPESNIVMSIPGIAAQCRQRLLSGRDYRDIASMGFAAGIKPFNPSDREIVARRIAWLVGSEPYIEHVPRPFCTDAVALLGIAFATKALQDGCLEERMAAWMAGFLPQSYHLPAVNDWDRCVLAVSQHLICANVGLAVPNSPAVADVRTLFRVKGFLPNPRGVASKKDEEVALRLMTDESINGLGLARSAARLAALRCIRRSATIAPPSRATVEDVTKILQRVPAGLRRWTWESERDQDKRRIIGKF